MICSDLRSTAGRGGGLPHETGGWNARRKFWSKPVKVTNLGVTQPFLTLKRDHFKLWLHEWSKQNDLKNIYIFIFLRTTFMAKYSGVLPRTPQVRPKSEICITKRDDKHPCPFHMGVSPGLWSLILSRVTPKECTQRNWSRDLTNTICV